MAYEPRLSATLVFLLAGFGVRCRPSGDALTSNLLLQSICDGGGCVPTGDVTIEAGITADTKAFRIGPGGRLDVRFDAETLRRAGFSDAGSGGVRDVEVFMKGSALGVVACADASCADASAPETLHTSQDDFGWVNIWWPRYDPAGGSTYPAVLSLRGHGDASVTVVELRAVFERAACD